MGLDQWDQSRTEGRGGKIEAEEQETIAMTQLRPPRKQERWEETDFAEVAKARSFRLSEMGHPQRFWS